MISRVTPLATFFDKFIRVHSQSMQAEDRAEDYGAEPGAELRPV